MSAMFGARRLIGTQELVEKLQREAVAGRSIPLLILRMPEFAQTAWSDGKRVAQRLERSTANAFADAAQRVVRDNDELAHEPGTDWFAVAMLAPSRDGAFAVALDARAALERIAATMSLTTGRRMETGWWPVETVDEARGIYGTIARALERGARERERYEFLATVGHELRTPLTSIRGYIETLLEDDVDPVTAKRFLETARREALRLGRLVDGMLEFSLLDLSPRGPSGITDVCDQVASALEALEPIARERGIALRHNLTPRMHARIDADACTHALVNLVENAIKYGRDGGRVVVSSTVDDPYLCIMVDDDGPGIAPSEREKIFALRSRGTGVHQPGCGIGLAIVKTIVERAAGSIAIEDSPLGGARFALRIPLASLPEAESVAVLS